MREELNHKRSRDANNGHFYTDRNNHVPDLSGEQCEYSHKAAESDDEKAVCSIFAVNSLQQCTLESQKALEDKPASIVCNVNQEKATTTATGLNLEVGAQESWTSYGGGVVQKSVKCF